MIKLDRSLAETGPGMFAAIGLLTVLVALFVLDLAMTANTARSQRIRELSATIATADADRFSADRQEMLTMATARLEKSRSGILSGKTDGLNSASLQLELDKIFEQCGLTEIFVDIDSGVNASTDSYTTYLVNIRARDRKRYFPLCLQLLDESKMALDIQELDWSKRAGSFRIGLRALGDRSKLKDG